MIDAMRLLLRALPVSIIALAALTGCVPTADEPVTQPTAVATTAPPSATPSATPTAGDVDGIPVTITCDQLVPPQAMYDYNPNFGLEAGYSPATGSRAAEIVKQNGLACAWVNQSSGDRIEVAVAELPEPHSTRLKNELITTSNSVPTYEVEGYFAIEGSVGVAEAFPDPFWVVASSTVFLEPGDVSPLMAAAVTALGS